MSNIKATPNGGVAEGVITALERLRELEALFLGGPLMSTNEAKCFSTETLLDVLMVLYNECCNSSLRKEKTVSEFIELGKKFVMFLKSDIYNRSLFSAVFRFILRTFKFYFRQFSPYFQPFKADFPVIFSFQARFLIFSDIFANFKSVNKVQSLELSCP